MIDTILLILGGAGTILAAIIAATWRGKSKGRAEERARAQTEALKDAQERMERGRQAVSRGRDGSTPADRLRRNDGKW